MGSQNNPGDESSTRLDRLNRRNLLRGSAVAAAAGLAGCSGDGGGDGDTTTTEDTTTDGGGGGTTTTTADTTTTTSMGEPLDTMWDIAISPRAPPDKLHWNRYNPKQNARGTWSWDSMAYTHPGLEDALFETAILESVEWDTNGPSLRFNLRDTKWWDGTQVDSQDVWVKAMMEAATNRRAHRVVANEYDMSDERTLVMKFGTSANPQVMQTQAAGRSLDTPYDQANGFFGKKADRVWGAHQGFDDGNVWDTDVLNTVAEELTTERIPRDQAFGNGLFKHDSYSSQQISATVHDGHWLADKWQGMEGATMHYAPDEDQRIGLFLSGTTEIQGSLPSAVQNEAPDNAVRLTGPKPSGRGLAWNQTVEPFDNLDVRKGMMFAMDRQRVVDNMPSDLWQVDETITGVSVTESLYIQDEHFDAFPTYGVGGDQARAEEHFQRDDRLSKSNGSWLLNESAWEFTFKTYRSTQTNPAQTIKSQLEPYGINASIQSIEGGTYWGQMYPGSNFDATVNTCMGWRFYPYNGFNEDVVGIGSLNYARNNGYPGAKPSNKTPPRVKGEIDAPPVGASQGIDADYSETYNPPELLQELLTSSDPDRNRELITTIGWIAATTLPVGYLMYGGIDTWVTNDHWNIPAEDSPNHLANVKLVQSGFLTPKRQ